MLNYQQGEDQSVVHLSGEMTIYHAAELKEALNPVLDDPAELLFDLSGVMEIDSAGVQLLLLAKKHRSQQSLSLHLVNHSHQVLELFQLMGLISYFNDPVVLTNDTGGKDLKDDL